ncbi:MAG: hypothetical protein R3282_00725 [Rhodothermales bacterium]|nr:hypothetical protein [Rhodothermales bacterium]
MKTLENRLVGNRLAIITMSAITLVAMLIASGFTVEDSLQPEHRTGMFAGVKANKGYAIHNTEGGLSKLTWSDDFVIPDTPDPHWQVVDSKGNVYLLQRLTIKDDKQNRTIVVPNYVRDIAKVQIWCAWAETLLGEASFEKPVS